MTRILMAEDHGLVAGLVQKELVTVHHHEVTRVDTPAKAIQRLKSSNEYGVVIVDLLFDPLTQEFETRRRDGKITPTSRFLTSGLAVIKYLNRSRHPARPVLWSAADPTRHLQIIFAYEYLKVRAFCSKDSRAGNADNLNRAIHSAAAGAPYVDPVINSLLPGRGVARLAERLKLDANHLAIWHALALRYHSREEIVAATGFPYGTVKNLINDFAHTDFHGRNRSRGVGLARLAEFAASNWEFFLDETVREEFR